MFKRLIPLLIAASLNTGHAVAESFSDKINSAMNAEHRTMVDRARDDNRLPAETLAFFGIQSNMKVLELLPGKGWYTNLLAPALKDQGTLYVALGTNRIMAQLDDNPSLAGVKIEANDSKLVRDDSLGLYNITNFNLTVKDLDAVLTFRNYHNLTEQSRHMLNKAVFDSLKPGGIYGVIDHTRRHMAEHTSENHRRVDPVLAIKEIQAAGFEFIDYSTLHYRPDDELRYEVGRKTVTGNTDRFTFLFKKPL